MIVIECSELELTLDQVVLQRCTTENQTHVRADALQSLSGHRLVILDFVTETSDVSANCM